MASSKSDRISNLPDEIIWHILDFLPTNTAVSTSVLSKRWQFLWRYIIDLHFDDELLNKEDDDDEINISISNFFKQLEVKRIRSLSLKCNYETWYGYDNSNVQEWVLGSIKLNVERLELCSSRKSITLPRVLFTNVASLFELKLSGNIGLQHLPDNVCFPNLKNLDLVSVDYMDIEKIQKLISGCLALEKLYIEISSWMSRWAVCSISSSSLTHLTLIINESEKSWLRSYYYPEQPDGIHGKEVKLDAPNLRYIRIRDDDQFTAFSVVGIMSSLIEADIDLCSGGYYNPGLVQQFVRHLSDVKILTIPTTTIQALCFGAKDTIPIFQNMTHLKIKTDLRSWNLFLNILERSMNLQALTIVEGRDMFRRTKEKPYDQRHVPKCLTSSLEQIAIHGYEGQGDQLKTVKLLLENGQVLKKMVIHDAFGVQSQLSRWEMQMLHKATRNCFFFEKDGENLNIINKTKPSYESHTGLGIVLIMQSLCDMRVN